MNTLTIRPATPEDTSTVFQFITELAIYEKAEHEVITDETQIKNSLFGKDSVCQALICEQDAKPIGFAVFFYNYSTWLGRNGLFLEDLYVTPDKRGVGAGKLLMQKLAQHAIEKQCGRFEWNVLDWNQTAIEFYESIGAKPQSEWIGYRLEGDALDYFATQ